MNTKKIHKINKDGQLPVAPSRKKIIFPVSVKLRQYLRKNGREINLPVEYKDLLHFTYARPLLNQNGEETAWEQVSYDMREWEFLKDGLLRCYAILKTEGDYSFAANLNVERIDFCSFGNSQPFRIRIINIINGNYDHFYIKQADANRIYGLELEHLLSASRVTFFTYQETLIEEHIAGIPGDIFIRDYLQQPEVNMVRLLKTFVKFNESCFVRLLGDMRSYNFVVDITPDIEGTQYNIRAIDFDQQTYEGRMRLYLPQFAKENYAIVREVIKHLDSESVKQYQAEERSRLAYRITTERYRVQELMDAMVGDPLSTPEKTEQLKFELANYSQNISFVKAKTMGEILKIHLKQMLMPSLQSVLKMARRRNAL
ncbi:MAG TPA: hypothetical protein VL053_01275 [Arachidicoccus sp.]|nr:hypothetical protein [Arachidicoccus sp.]